MGRLGLVVAVAIVVLLVVGLAGLALWDIPAPSAQVEKVVPNDRFQR